MKRDELPELVDRFGRMQDRPFEFNELFRHVRSKAAGKVDEDDVFELAATSDYLFESWQDPQAEIFVPRRTFFQGAQFLVAPTREEIEGGFLFPGDRFFPFVSREVFPADVRLVLADGRALATRIAAVPMSQAMDYLRFYGSVQAGEYLEMDREDGAKRRKPARGAEVEAAVFDLRDFFAEHRFQPRDGLKFVVLDWLQGVLLVEHAPAGQTSGLPAVQDWVAAMRDGLEDALVELDTDGDCYEQLAFALFFAMQYNPEARVMGSPPLSLAAFIDLRKDIAVEQAGDRALFRRTGAEAGLDGDVDDEALDSELDGFFRELGLYISEGEAEAYLRDALFRGEPSPDAVLARLAADRSLFFRSADAQDRFHHLWSQLAERVAAEYDPKSDPYGDVRFRFAALNDKCLAAMRKAIRTADGGEPQGTDFDEFCRLFDRVRAGLRIFNSAPVDAGYSPEAFVEIADELVSEIERMLPSAGNGAERS